MVRNGSRLLECAPIRGMFATKERKDGVSHGLAEVGYDIRLKQTVLFQPTQFDRPVVTVCEPGGVPELVEGRFTIASAIEEFDMPDDLVGIVHDKSTWARRGLSVFNTVIEPGWRGFLTLELVHHGQEELLIEAGTGIAQVVFHELAVHSSYEGKYQDQEDRPIEAR